jgi:two-component system, chemotaxis family, protein-glutamate methylesterase/glutaminase
VLQRYTSGPVVVVGASLGGVEALRRLARNLPADFRAPLVAVLHIGANPSILPALISQAGPLVACHAKQGMPLEPGKIFIAPPDQHVLIQDDSLILSKGPKEHHARPAIDPLFRSAALSRGAEVIGVVLTGLLDDGTAGLQAIKAAGGTAIAQDPAEAMEPSMPASARRHVDLDHCLDLDDIAALLPVLASQARATTTKVDPLVRHEFDIFMSKGDPMSHLQKIGRPSTFTCPDCGGSLWHIKNADPSRYRCHTGHAFSLSTLENAHAGEVDVAMWSALRALQEREKILETQMRECGEGQAKQALAKKQARNVAHAKHLRAMIEEIA